MLDPQRVRTIIEQSRLAPCVESLGLDFLEFDEGFCKLRAPQDARFDGLIPGFHGGMQANVADCVAYFAIATVVPLHERLVTTDLFLRYLAPCLGDVTAEARLIKFGRTLCPVDIKLFDPAGKAVAVGQVTYMRVDNVAHPR